MQLTLEADYAVRIVYVLGILGEKTDAKSISEKAGVTLRFSLKILRKLVAAGIVRSYKGTQGGYELERPPEAITLREVVETVEGTYYLNRCLNPNNGCERAGTCKVQKVFCNISRMVREELQKVTFDQLIPGRYDPQKGKQT